VIHVHEDIPHPPRCAVARTVPADPEVPDCSTVIVVDELEQRVVFGRAIAGPMERSSHR